MTKLDDIKAAIERRGGSMYGKTLWRTAELQGYLDTLPPEPAPQPRGRRAAAVKADVKLREKPPLEQPPPKKPKPLETLAVAEPGETKPSEALIKACTAVLADHGKPPREEGDLMTPTALTAALKRDYNVTGTGAYRSHAAIADATRLLHKRYKALDGAARANSPLRWLDASWQTKMSSQFTESRKKKEDEVEAMATEVATAVAAARMAKFKYSFYGRNAVELAGTTLGLYAEHTLVKVLRATTVQEALQWGVAPPWLTEDQVAAFWRVLAKLPPSMPLYDVKEGALVPTGLPRVDFWIALAEPIAALAALEPCFASLAPLVGYMLPVHVKKNTPTFGPGGGAHKNATLTSDVEALARRFRNARSSIVRGAGALQRSGNHIYTPADASLDRLPGPNEGLVVNCSLAINRGVEAVEGLFIGETFRETWSHETDEFGGDNAASVTTFTPEAAKAGHDEARDSTRFQRENAFEHAPAAALLAATLDVGNFSLVSSWVRRDAFLNPSPAFVLELYQKSKAVEWSQHAGLGPALELATGCWLVAADLRLELSRKGGAYDSELVASRDALLQRLRARGAKLEWKARNQDRPVVVVHGAAGLVASARMCDIVVWTDLGFGPTLISAADAPFSEDNIERTLQEVHNLHKALGASRDHDEAYGKFLASNAALKNTRLAFCFIGDLDKKGVPLEAQTRRVSFAADWAVVKRDICNAIDYCLERRDAWCAATPPAWETTGAFSLGPRVPTGDPIKLVPPTGPGVAADIYQSAPPAPPAPPLVVQPHGTAGGLAVVPKAPRLLTKKPRPAPWTESATRACAAAPPKKKARR